MCHFSENIAVVLVTVPNVEVAYSIAKTIVKEKIAACVNVIPEIRSIYTWEEDVCDEPEALMIIKTRRQLFEKLKERVTELHPYDVPEIIALPLVDGIKDYLSWVLEVTQNPAE